MSQDGGYEQLNLQEKRDEHGERMRDAQFNLTPAALVPLGTVASITYGLLTDKQDFVPAGAWADSGGWLVSPGLPGQ